MKNFIFISIALLLTACGFHPVYGVNKYTPVGAETKFGQIDIANIPNREGQFLRNELMDRFYRSGRPENTQYILQIAPIRETKRELDITIDSNTTRAQLKLATSLQLIDKSAGKPVLVRKLQSTASYNVLGSEFANRVSEQTTRENVLEDLARQIELQLALYFKNPPPPEEPEDLPLRLPNAR